MATGEQAGSEEQPWNPWEEESQGERSFAIGLDLGQTQDFTALTVVRRTDLYRGEIKLYLCNHIVRYSLGTSYMDIVDSVSSLVQRPELQLEKPNWRGRIRTVYPTLVVDQTGVGRAVVNMFERALRQLQGTYALEPVVIHGGRHSGRAEGGAGWSVSKIDLISAVQACLGEGRLRIVQSLAHADTLKKELMDYRVKVSPVGNESFDARSGQHDDIVLSIALAIWFGENDVRRGGVPR